MSELTLRALSDLVMDQAKAKGFGTTPADINVADKMMLIHSELSEAFVAYLRHDMDGKDGFRQELGDVLQRLLHLAGALDIDLEAEVLRKLEANKGRVWNLPS